MRPAKRVVPTSHRQQNRTLVINPQVDQSDAATTCCREQPVLSLWKRRRRHGGRTHLLASSHDALPQIGKVVERQRDVVVFFVVFFAVVTPLRTRRFRNGKALSKQVGQGLFAEDVYTSQTTLSQNVEFIKHVGVY